MNSILDFDINEISTKPKLSHTPTDEQQSIIDHELKKGECLKVIAYAGTGKTSTFVDYALCHPADDMLYLAFNKSVEMEAKEKFSPNVLPKTIHALAYRFVGSKYKDISNGLKVWEIQKLLRVPLYNAAIIRATLENYLNSADDIVLPAHVVPDELGLLKPGYETAICNHVESLFIDMQESRVPMTHSGYLKMFQLSRPKLEWPTILLDEAQDTNPVTLSLILDQLQHGTKIILCGDPYQQIYSWRGAIDAMEQVDCKTLRLTKSFRFGDNIVKVANKLLLGLLGEQVPVVGTEQPDRPGKSCIICRTNAGLFMSARSQDRFSVVGEQRLFQLLDDLTDIYRIMSGQRPVSRALAFYRSFSELEAKARESLDYELQMKAGIVSALGSSLPCEIRKVRSSLASESDLVLVTGHQAKGLEWNKVTLAADFPSLQDVTGKTKIVAKQVDKMSETHIAREECNLLYVACTRARKELKPGHSVERFLSA